MLAAANNSTATPKRRGSSNIGLRSEHSSSINLDTSDCKDDGNDMMLKDTSERSYHQQSEELVHNTSDSSFIKVALLKQKQKIWNEQHEMDTNEQQQGGSSDDTSIYSWDRKLSILKQKQRNREDMNEQRKHQQQQQRQQRLDDPTRVAASDTTPQTISQQSTTNNNEQQQIDILTEGQHYLSISMLVYMYSHLRETCRMGHTRINFEDIDVNSFQSLYGQTRRRGSDGSGEGGEERIRYLDKTKSSGSIIRVVIDELGSSDDDIGLRSSNGGGDKRDYDLIGVNASREYEQR